MRRSWVPPGGLLAPPVADTEHPANLVRGGAGEFDYNDRHAFQHEPEILDELDNRREHVLGLLFAEIETHGVSFQKGLGV